MGNLEPSPSTLLATSPSTSAAASPAPATRQAATAVLGLVGVGRGQSRAVPAGRARRVGYRMATAVMIAECVAGGILDLARQPPFYPTMIQLGYPPYFAGILGTAKLLAAGVLLAPGLPRLKEWAYAGILINMVGAAASHLAVRDGLSNLAPPAAFALIALASWQLRQPALPGSPAEME